MLALGTGALPKILDKYFTLQPKAKPGLLLAYYNNENLEPVHYAICYTEEIAESKWGKDPVYRHPFFYTDIPSGNKIECLGLKEGYTKEEVVKLLNEGDYKK